MDLVLVPRVQAADPDTGLRYFRPSLPASLDRAHGWGQASSEFEPDGKVLCWVRADAAELDAISRQAGSRVVGRCATDAQSDRMVAALRAGDLKSSRDEFVAAYRALAVPEEDAARAARGRARIASLVAMVGLVAAAALLARWLGIPEGAAIGLVVLHQDNFNRANENLGVSGMSDGLGVWTILSGTPTVTSNQETAGGAALARDSAMDAASGDQRVTIKVIGVPPGIVARGNSTFSTCYSARPISGAGNKLRLFRGVGTTQLGSDSSAAVAANDAIAVDCAGSSISALINGGTACGPVTDSNYASGQAGLWHAGGGAILDDWQVEVAAGGSPWRTLAEEQAVCG